MNEIWKYKLEVVDNQTIELPINSGILSLQIQHGEPCIWVAVDLDETESKEVEFITIGTGNAFDIKNKHFLGTYQLHKGALVFHVFIKI